MTFISASSRAAGVGASAILSQLVAGASVMPRAVLVIGTGLSASYTAAGVVANTPELVTSPEASAVRYGRGTCLARTIAAVYRGSGGAVKVWALPQAEAGGAAAATGSLAVTASSAGAGTIPLYVAGTLYSIAVAANDTATTIGDAIVAALAADADCPVTGVNTTGTVAITAKSKGVYGNFISLAAASQPGDVMPSGVSIAVTAMSSGSGTPSVSTGLSTGLGSGDHQNLLPDGTWATDVVMAYGQDQTALTALSTYNEANYADLVARPFRSLIGDVGGASNSLSTLITLGTTNISDRTNGVVPVPGSLTHPNEIAGVAIGYMAASNNNRASANYVDALLPGVDPGWAAKAAGYRWTDDYTNRDTAVKGGISPTVVVGSQVFLQNVVTFYHPTSVAAKNNIYSEMANVSKIQNILAAVIANFSGPKWQQFTVVDDTANVTDQAEREKARDVGDVTDDWVGLIKSFVGFAWLFSGDLSMNALKDKTNPAIVVRQDGTGFTCSIPFVLSGVGNIITSTLKIDINVAAAQAAA